MVKKILSIAGVIIAFTFVATVVFYSTAALTPEVAKADANIAYGAINSPYADVGTCQSLPRNLSLGSRGDDVALLQTYLVGHGYPGSGAWMITGYFGKMTQTVVATLQRERGLPVTGDLDTATRTLLAIGCSPLSQPPYTAQQPYQLAQPAQLVQYVYQYQYPYPCTYSYYQSPCTPPEPLPPPPATITDVSGPTSITVYQPGSWVVDVAAPNANTNSTLSVTWSDPSYSNSGVPQVTHTIYGNQTFTFAHTFNTLGVYYVTFTITDSLGRKDSKTILVKAIERNYPFY